MAKTTKTKTAKTKKALDSFSESKKLKNKIEKTQNEIEKLRTQLNKDGEKLFQVSCKEIFNKHDFKSFAWTQYTPHRNDGDECTFHAHTDSIYIDGEEDEEDYYNLENFIKDLKQKDKSIKKLEEELKSSKQDWEINSKKERIKQLNSANLEDVEKRYEFLKDVIDLLETIDSDTFQEMFGDHAKVVVSKNNVEVESYEHD